MSDLHVCTPNFYEDTGVAVCKRLVLQDSCKRVGIKLHPFGEGKQWNGNWEAKLVEFEKYLRGVEEPYVMMIDGDDSLMVRGAAAILAEFNSYKAPVLLAANKKPWPQTVECFNFPRTDGYSYPNAGGVIGYTIRVWEAVAYILNHADAIMDTRSDQEGWVREYLRLNNTVGIDHWCKIFQNMSAGGDEDVRVPSLVYNRVTDSNPCVIHFGGRTKGREEMWEKIKNTST